MRNRESVCEREGGEQLAFEITGVLIAQKQNSLGGLGGNAVRLSSKYHKIKFVTLELILDTMRSLLTFY